MECSALAKLAELSIGPKAAFDARAAKAGIPASEAKACALAEIDAIAAELVASAANEAGLDAMATRAGLAIENANAEFTAEAACPARRAAAA